MPLVVASDRIAGRYSAGMPRLRHMQAVLTVTDLHSLSEHHCATAVGPPKAVMMSLSVMGEMLVHSRLTVNEQHLTAREFFC